MAERVFIISNLAHWLSSESNLWARFGKRDYSENESCLLQDPSFELASFCKIHLNCLSVQHLTLSFRHFFSFSLIRIELEQFTCLNRFLFLPNQTDRPHLFRFSWQTFSYEITRSNLINALLSTSCHSILSNQSMPIPAATTEPANGAQLYLSLSLSLGGLFQPTQTRSTLAHTNMCDTTG